MGLGEAIYFNMNVNVLFWMWSADYLARLQKQQITVIFGGNAVFIWRTCSEENLGGACWVYRVSWWHIPTTDLSTESFSMPHFKKLDPWLNFWYCSINTIYNISRVRIGQAFVLWTYELSQWVCEIGTIIWPILHMRELRLREVKWLALLPSS